MHSNSCIDAVFVLGSGTRLDDAEFKYALRNMDANCPFIRNVYLVGECPVWVDRSKIIYIPCKDIFEHSKYANIIHKLKLACEQPGIAEKILFCSDDQFQTRICTWEDFRPRYLRAYRSDDIWYSAKNSEWHNMLANTLEREKTRRKENGIETDSIYYYQPHMWMQIDRDKFIEYAKWSEYPTREDIIPSSGYYNFIGASPDKNFDHAFIREEDDEIPESKTHIGYSDESFVAALVYLTRKFPNRSKYETQDSLPVPVQVHKGDTLPAYIIDKMIEMQDNAAREAGTLASSDETGSQIDEHLSNARNYLNTDRGIGDLERILAKGELILAHACTFDVSGSNTEITAETILSMVDQIGDVTDKTSELIARAI